MVKRKNKRRLERVGVVIVLKRDSVMRATRSGGGGEEEI